MDHGYQLTATRQPLDQTERECLTKISDAIVHYLFDIGAPRRPSRSPLFAVANYLNCLAMGSRIPRA